MADEKEKGTEKVVDPAALEKKRKMLLFIIIGAIIVLEIPVMLILINVTRPKSPDEIAASERADSLRTAMQAATSMGATTAENPIEVIVNIAGTDNERFLKIKTIFEFDDKAYPKLAEDLVVRQPKLKNVLLEMLSKMTLMELNEPTSKERIRKEYMRLVNGILPESVGQVSNVLLDEFIIQ